MHINLLEQPSFRFTVACFVDDNHEAPGFETAAEGARHVPQYAEVSGVCGSL